MLAHILHRKTLNELNAAAQQEQGFRRTLGTVQLTLLGVGFVIGTGIFVLTGQIAAQHAGPAVCLSFVLAALPAALAAFCYAEMVTLIPAAGGAYTYVSASLGELPGFLIGWTLILAYLVGTATVASGWSAYMCGLFNLGPQTPALLPFLNAPLQLDPVSQSIVRTGALLDAPALLIILAVTWVASMGARESMAFTAGLVVLKLMVVGVFLASVAPVIDPGNWSPFVPIGAGGFGHFGWSGVLQGGSIAVFAYLGVDNLSTAVQEAKDPQRSMPRAIAITMVCCTLLYAAVCLVLTGAVPYAQLGVPDPIALGVAATGHTWLTSAVQLGTLAGLTSVLLMQLYGLPRIVYAMARDGLAPRWAAALHPRHAAPRVTTWVMGLLGAAGAALVPMQVLSTLTSAGVLLTFACVSAGVMVLRHRHPRARRRFRVPFGAYLLPGLSTLFCLTMLAATPLRVLSMLSVWLLGGLGMYALASWRRDRQSPLQAVAQPQADGVP